MAQAPQVGRQAQTARPRSETTAGSAAGRRRSRGCSDVAAPEAGVGCTRRAAGWAGAAAQPRRRSSVPSVSSEIAMPAPASRPPGDRGSLLRKVRLSVLLSGFMPAVRVRVVGVGVLLGVALAAPGVVAARPAGVALLADSVQSARAARSARVAQFGHASQSAAACEPTTLNTSAMLAGSVTVSPLPGSRDASPQTQISFLGRSRRRAEPDQRRRLAHRRAHGAPRGLLAGRRRQLRAGQAVRRRVRRSRSKRSSSPPAAPSSRCSTASRSPTRTRSAPRPRRSIPAVPGRSRAFARVRTCARRRSP